MKVNDVRSIVDELSNAFIRVTDSTRGAAAFEICSSKNTGQQHVAYNSWLVSENTLIYIEYILILQ